MKKCDLFSPEKKAAKRPTAGVSFGFAFGDGGFRTFWGIPKTSESSKGDGSSEEDIIQNP